MDFSIIIIIAITILASVYNDAQKRRRAMNQTPQEPEESPMEQAQPQLHEEPRKCMPRPAMSEESLKRIQEFHKRIEQARLQQQEQRRIPQPQRPLEEQTEPLKRIQRPTKPLKKTTAKSDNDTQQGSESHFDIEQAIVYSEILQPKFKEYE